MTWTLSLCSTTTYHEPLPGTRHWQKSGHPTKRETKLCPQGSPNNSGADLSFCTGLPRLWSPPRAWRLHIIQGLVGPSKNFFFLRWNYSHIPQLSLLVKKRFQDAILPSYKCQSLSRVWLFATPWTVAHQAPLSMEFSSKNTGVGSLSLLQGIFLTQELNKGLLQHRQILYSLSHQGSPREEILRCHFTFKKRTIQWQDFHRGT